MAGNPGGTERVPTIEQLALQRDVVLPWIRVRLAELRGTLLDFSAWKSRALSHQPARIPDRGERAQGPGWPSRLLAEPTNFERKRNEDAELRAA